MSGHYAATTARVKPAAFLPPANGNTSVYCTSQLDADGIWKHGAKYVEPASNRTIEARADLCVSAVNSAELEVTLDNKPPLHANIHGWPEEKPLRKQRALELAGASVLYIRSTP